jgi:hypothetical protein
MRTQLLVVVAIFCAGCATPTLTPVPLSGQLVEYKGGLPTIISRQQRSAVITALVTNEVQNHAIFYIAACNTSGAPATFGTENVSANSGGRTLRVLSYEQLVHDQRVKDTWQRVGLAMAAGARAGAAAQPAQTNVYGGYYGSDGYSGQYFGSATTYDPAATAVAQSAISADTRAQAATLNAANAARMNQLSGILRTTTVHPGQFAGGVVEVNDAGMNGIVTLNVEFVGEMHRFAFRLTK